VFLQEQSNGIRRSSGYVAARLLDDAARAAGARGAMFMTWRDRGAAPESYDSLLGLPGGDSGYLPIALELGEPLAPVGWAIRNYVIEGQTADLWKGPAGHHLNRAGNYLASCVLYAVLTRDSPEGVYAVPYLDAGVSAELERIATETVLSDPAQWNLLPR
jgi:hypothetical protein